jgi:hypothetical protein
VKKSLPVVAGKQNICYASSQSPDRAPCLSGRADRLSSPLVTTRAGFRWGKKKIYLDSL